MSSIQTPPPKEAAASSSLEHDPALDKAAANEGALTPAGSPSPAGAQASGDGALHLQNAHYGALDVETPDGASSGQGSAGADNLAPPPLALDLENHPDVPSLTSQTTKALAATQPAQPTPPGEAPAGLSPATNSQAAATETFSFNTGYTPTPNAASANVNAAPANINAAPANVDVPPQTSAAAEDKNEAPADISLSNTTIAENAAGAVVGTLTTVDPDSGDTHSYSVSDNRFEVVDGQLKLKDGVSLDHESEPSVSVTVTSTDASGASLSEDFTINVANVNEGPSDIGLSNTTIAENAAGAVVGTLSTADADAGDTFTYSVSDNRFEVVDGQLKLKDGISLDHEGEPSVSVTVTSTDASGASLSEDFTISVTNVNEGPSDIGLSNTTVAENAAGAVVGTLTTVDPDAGDTHSYSVSDNRFEVVDGQLKLKDGVSLDHEAEPSVSVTVTSTDASGASISEDFTISVSNVNEGPSDIGLSNTTVAENAAGAVVGTLSTADADAGDTHSYSVSDNRFEVVDGQLKLKDGISLDHEAEPSVSVTVTSTDASGASLSEDFTINVANVNEGPSDIGLSNTTIAENAAGAVVGTLSTADADAGDTHSYSVSDNRFEVVDGQLKLKDGISLDHESEPSVSVTVTSTDASGASISEDFTISVSNVNEGPSDIGLSNTTIAENAAGAVVGTLSTADADAGDTHSYTVSDNRFEVVDGQLKLKDGISLDHEAEPSVSVTVTSTDASGASLSEDFTIGVSNVNEGPSDIGLSNTTVAENAAGAVVGTLSTADADAGDTHSYSVSDNRFEVVDGQLKLKDGISLDHEGEPSVSVTVTSTDASGASLSEDFTINVANVNEGPSDIGLSNTTVAENAAGAVVGTLSTADADAGDTHSYSVSDNRFEVVDGQLKLKDGISLDHEAEPSVSVTVTSTDASGASLSEDFTINVANVNEGPSDIGLSNTTVAENAAGAVVGTLSTADADAGDTHSYSVSDNRFEVVDGQLKLKDGISLDHEGEPSVSVTVTSTDASGASLSEDFTINVSNVNEGPSDIGLSNTTVAENAAGAIVGTLSTTDVDAGDTHSYTVSDNRFEVVDGQLKLKDGVSLDHEGEPSVSVTVTSTDASGASLSEDFTISVSNVNEGPSDIGLSNTTVAENAAGAVVGTLSTADVDAGDTHSYSVSDTRFEVVDGQLKLKDGISLDHESEPSVSVTVTSTDASGASISEDFTISVSNVNEGPSDIGLSNTTVAENAAGAVVGTLSTADADAGDTHSYAVSDNRFEVVDGQLKLKDGISLDHEAEPSVSVTVTSTDASGASLSEDFTINVANVNEGPSDIGLSNTTVAENAAGAIVGTLSTADADAGDTHSYSVSDNRFEVVDGQLKLKDGISLDHESEPSVSVTVTSTDASGASLSEDFTISVSNVNEGPNDIGLSNTTVAENAAGAVVGTLTTVDADAGDTHSYSVSDNRFEVVDGQLKLKDGISLDHEAEPSVSVTVTSTDASGASLSEDFTIGVANVNEGPSDIGLSNTTVAENAAGAVVGTLSTADADAGDTHSYSVSDNRFEVVDGQLKLKDGISLDHEAEPSVSVTVTSTDASGASLSEDFTISVSNVNEGPSDIGLSNTTVAENAAGAVVGTLSTADADAGDTHSYTVSDNRFEVVDGQLKLKDGVSLDHEAEPSVSVTVTSTDASGASLSEDFTIGVANVNEGPSDIGLSNTTVAENAAGAVVGTLSTADADAGDTHSYAVSDNRFEVVDGQLKLKDGISLDHESKPSVSVTVTSTDASGASLSEDFTINAANVNEGPTKVSLSDTSISEGLAGGVVGTVTTTDPDAGDQHSYTVSDSRFEVVDGQLKLKDGVSLDYESRSTVSLTVTATDAGGLSQSQAFKIVVTNANDAPTDITLSTNTVSENVAGAVIGTLSTTDQDKGNTFTYSVSDDRFEVISGKLKLKSGVSLDYEAEPTVKLTVTTADNSGATYSETFAIEVQDANESVGTDYDDKFVGGEGNDIYDGGKGNDQITGNGGNDTLSGGADNDTIDGGAGNDTIEGGSGTDKLTGGTGTDTLSYASSTTGVSVNLATNTVSGGDAQGDTISAFENVTGSSASDTITGDGNANTVLGGAGNDTIDGGAGNDTIEGGTGADKLTGGTGTDTLSYASSTNGVNVNLATNTVSGGDAQGDTISTFENVTGSSASDTITGDGNANTVLGGAGNDTIDGGAGNDTIEGGAGSDTLSGGSGTGDTLSYANSSSGVTVNLLTNAVSGGDAQGDKVSGFENVTGSQYDDVVYGNNSNNVISTGEGNDRVYVSGGIDTIDGGADSDTIDLANFSGANMTIDLGKGLVYYTAYPAGADSISNFENASGTNASDTFHGSSADNTMWGQAGNDTFNISTGGGHDTVYGGTGTDIISINTGGGSGGWLETVADPSSVTIGAGDWLLELDTGEAYLLHGSGGAFDFAAPHAGILTAFDGTEVNFADVEGLHW